MRERGLEARWLNRIATDAELPRESDYTVRIEGRLDRGHRVFGDAWLKRTPVDIAEEVREEIEDIPAWSVLLLQLAVRHRDSGDLSPQQLARIGETLREVARLSGHMDVLVGDMLADLT